MPAEDSPILALFRQWKALDVALTDDASNDESAIWVDQMNAIDRKMESIPATTAAEFAAKMLIGTYFGAFGFEEGPLFTEAMALVNGRT